MKESSFSIKLSNVQIMFYNNWKYCLNGVISCHMWKNLKIIYSKVLCKSIHHQSSFEMIYESIISIFEL
jgi:hypothetical protein